MNIQADHGIPADLVVRSSKPAVVVDRLTKVFTRADRREVRAIDDVSLTVEPGEFLVLLGPSGCGKTTLLRCIAGLEQPDSGRISIDGRAVFDSTNGLSIASDKRGTSMIFQSYALWPHMTAFKNVAYPLESIRKNRPGKAEIRERVLEALTTVGIGDLGDQYPHQLSGGQQQRVALARALVMRSPLMLFDEPLSNVDAKVREQLRYELVELQQAIGFAAVYVTHDQAEAMALADRVAVIQRGRVLQLDEPEVVYSRPSSSEVARFVGIANELPGTVESVSGDRLVASTAVGMMTATRGGRDYSPGAAVTLVWRPEDLVIGHTTPENSWAGNVGSTTFLGPHTEYRVESGDLAFRAWRHGRPDPSLSDVRVGVDPEAVWALPAEEVAA